MSRLSLLRHRWQGRGFSLLEILMVLAVMALVVGVAVAIFVTQEEDGSVKGPPKDLERMAKMASRGAIVQGRPVIIAFDKKSFSVIGGAGGSSSLPEDMRVKFQRFNDGKRWTDATGLNWAFFPSGLCDPLNFRFESPYQIVDMAFHPLTGTVTNLSVVSR
jgi:prepilin-type N-terminal cleavage/methylation domain-containing protein